VHELRLAISVLPGDPRVAPYAVLLYRLLQPIVKEQLVDQVDRALREIGVAMTLGPDQVVREATACLLAGGLPLLVEELGDGVVPADDVALVALAMARPDVDSVRVPLAGHLNIPQGAGKGSPRYSSDMAVAVLQFLIQVVPEPADSGHVALRLLHESGLLERFRSLVPTYLKTAYGQLETRDFEFRLDNAIDRYDELSHSEQMGYLQWAAIAAVEMQESSRAGDGSRVVGSVLGLPGMLGEKTVVAARRQGGQGEVLLCVGVRPTLGAVALKTVLEATDHDAFEHEARIWSSLADLPNVLRPTGYGIIDELPYILSNWYPRSLADVCGRVGRVQGFTLLSEIGGVLTEAHRRGVLHRDIKPSNVLLGDKGEALVADFGIAQAFIGSDQDQRAHFESGDWRKTTRVGAAAGTPAYMAPELFDGAAPSATTDAYAFGITALELLVGDHPTIDPRRGWTGGALRPGVAHDVVGKVGSDVGNLICALASVNPALRPPLDLVVDRLQVDLDRMAGLDEAPAADSSTGLDQDTSVTELLLRASVLRQQGRHKDSQRLLLEGINRLGADARLLDALAHTAKAGGAPNEEIRRVGRDAVLAVRREDGLIGGVLYLDPLINMFRHELLAERDLGNARRLILEADELRRRASSELRSRSHADDWYAEFGWLCCDRGEWGEAVVYVDRVLTIRENTDWIPLCWMLLASFMAGSERESAPRIARHLAHVSLSTVGPAACAFLCATWLEDASAARQLIASVEPTAAAALHQIMAEVVGTPVRIPPLPDEGIASILRGIAVEQFGADAGEALNSVLRTRGVAG
jgi:hypothetical protein